MAKSKTQHRCTGCGHIEPKWAGKCPSCQQWNSLVEEDVTSTKSVNPATKRGASTRGDKPKRLKDVNASKESRIILNESEFDRVMGGGIVRDSLNVLTAPPGAGKSTLLLIISNLLGRLGYRVLYLSGEESERQVKLRADRICPDISENVWFKSESNMNAIQDHIKEIDPDFIIMDSIQMAYLEEFPQSPGSPTQVLESTKVFKYIAKNPERPRAVFLVGHMTKQDELGGSRAFEHEVDAVFYLDGDRGEQLRILRTTKNRFGDTGETGLYRMEGEGLIPIDNPSEFFMTKREEPVAGSALTVTREGTRNIVVEIESLLEKTMFGFPTRVGEGINKQQLQILSAILEKRGGLVTGDKDVYVKVSAGLKLQEAAVNLGVVMSMVSSIQNRGIPTDTVFLGEVGLTGEIKSVPHLESRIKEVDRLGFKTVYVPKGNLRAGLTTKNVEVVEIGSISEGISKLYGQTSQKKKASTE
ncbi:MULTISPECIES: DNA repair protein RadA [unclassified Paenibacillus]|uniref:DNA repair protein RadA n=1 Tax=unclassified Paenibacillus TaxID=185978 RepID=UPI001AEAF6B2|nr:MULTISPECIES: DNA repair protein RadA [unclassified Paenibacillus]MBP1153650.1 DNA repair protein RadA/Sms [Paenibacillus sp. PvP091]MBP1170965.1 DNA repair protein RadA/Sms [Paenibacillus sp. PvR098]MBP2441993.1 DNA repair protein RadA/Sms [Paenibacillus sp. PvP052]